MRPIRAPHSAHSGRRLTSLRVLQSFFGGPPQCTLREGVMSSEGAPDLATQLNALLPLIVTNGLRALGAIAILLIGLWAAGKLHAIVVGLLERTPHVDEMLKRFFGSAARYLVLTVTVLAVLSQFGIQTTSYAAVLGAAALAIGLALQGTLSHLAAGVMLLAFRPFRIRHKIQGSGVTGRGKDLTAFWT